MEATRAMDVQPTQMFLFVPDWTLTVGHDIHTLLYHFEITTVAVKLSALLPKREADVWAGGTDAAQADCTRGAVSANHWDVPKP